jgi:predicted alpha/beta superfamily hydrolase
MKYTTLITLIFLLAVSVQESYCQQLSETIPSINGFKTEPVSVGYSIKFHSNILNEDRIVMISLPDDYSSTMKRYPVLYMPDGQWHFTHTTQAVGNLSGNGIIPKMIIVAVQTLDNRSRDLAASKEPDGKLGGGANKFLSFMKKELIPFIEKNYRTYPYRILSGSSFGGIFTAHAFFDDPEYFDAYLAYSPSIWWENGYYIKSMEKLFSERNDLKSYFYINVANEGLGMGVNALAKVFSDKAPKDFKWKFEEYPDEIHETTAYKATFNGMKFIFADWKPDKINFAVSGYLIKPGDSLTLTLNTNRTTHYTLDGSMPTITSPIYSNPIIIKQPGTIKAFSLFGHGIPGNYDSLNIEYLQKFNAVKALPELAKGLIYSYYEGNWNMIPEFKNCIPVKTGILDKASFDFRNRDINFAVRCTGYIDINEDDAYNFFLSSDDGSKLLIDNILIIDNDGLHGTIEKNKRLFLEKGKHQIELQFFQETGGFSLTLEYESSKIKRQIFPDKLFFHIEPKQ